MFSFAFSGNIFFFNFRKGEKEKEGFKEERGVIGFTSKRVR